LYFNLVGFLILIAMIATKQNQRLCEAFPILKINMIMLNLSRTPRREAIPASIDDDMGRLVLETPK
jgi:hypothetical protein